ncbi:MAG TPA: PDZ domain-containing protein [Blastocatellia bacterium]|nr:PDZ domain-containing protein [Blastocatellia bacterium]
MIDLNRVRRNTVLFALAPFVFAAAASAQTGPVSYTVTLDKRPTSHFVHVALNVNSAGAPSIDVAMPAWAPGAYGIHNAWRNVQEFSATDETGAALKFEKTDKQTWRIWRGSGRTITARYRLYLRSAYTDEMCYLRGPNVFMYVIGKRPYPVEGPVRLKLEAPASWRIQTGMDSGPEPNTFTSENYDSFIDASIVIGPDWEETTFDDQGARYHIVFLGKGNYDKEKITRDLKQTVNYLVTLMGGAPYKKYVFFLRARSGSGSGGLEHLNSTDISFSAWQTHSSWQNYSRFLFVAAHEFFHLWNVKRIRPAILGPFDYSREQNTRNLYVSEGMTSYWAAIGLKRSGLWSRKDYFDNLADQIKTLQSAPGRKIMSVELSSWDTWNQADNGDNNRIDYYNKGELLGNLLDLEIRFRTNNQKSLTDVFVYLLKNHGLPKPGFEEVHGFRDVVEMIVKQAAPAKADFGDFFAKYVSGVEEIPWNAFLDHAGIALEEKKGPAESYIGITTGTSIPTGAGPFGPATTPVPQGQIAITGIGPDSPAAEAGLDIGDILIAMDGDRIDPTSFPRRVGEKKPGSTIQMAVMRRDRLMTIPVTVGSREPIAYSIKEKPSATELQKQIFTTWLAEKKFEP